MDGGRALDAARARVEAVYAAVDRLGPRDLDVLAIPAPDPDGRPARISRLETLAANAGRAELLDEARDTLERELLERWTSQLRLAYVAESTMTGRAEDRAAAVTAVRDLVGVAVMADVLDRDDAAALSEPGRFLLGGDAPWEGAAASRASVPGSTAGVVPGAPTEADWAAAAREADAPRPWRPEPVPMLVAIVAAIALVLILVTRLAG